MDFHFHEEEINFLHTVISVTSTGRLAFKLFHLKMDKCTYFHYNSFHSKKLKDNIPSGQFLRIKKNSTNSDFLAEVQIMSLRFSNRGYHDCLVRSAYNKAKNVDCSSLCSDKSAVNSKRIMCSFQYTNLS